MKGKRLERVERRRSLVEMNLIGAEGRVRSAIRRKGCSLLPSSLLILAGLVAAGLGLR